MENRTPTPTERPKKDPKRLRQSHSTSEDKDRAAQFKTQAEPDIGLLLGTSACDLHVFTATDGA